MKMLREYKNKNEYISYQTEEVINTDLETRHDMKREETIDRFREKFKILLNNNKDLKSQHYN